MFDGKTVLITGGTGSLGTALTIRLLKMGVKQIRIFSRNEFKQVEMENKFNDDRLRFLLGDIRDFPRLLRATEDVDILFHAAALKHVTKVEYNPFEAIKTNVYGSQNVIDACIQNKVERAVCIGSDKGVSPLNTYGATKLLMEKLFITARRYSNPEKHPTKFFAVRYGNVSGSSGSVIPKFIEQIKGKQKISITDEHMTRFSITMDEALDFVLESTKIGHGSEIFVPKLRAYDIMELKDAIVELLDDPVFEIIGVRQGEKLHEILINNDEIKNAWEYNNLYIITDDQYKQKSFQNFFPGIKKIQNLDKYSSDVVQKLSKDELKKIITESKLISK